MVEEVGSLFRYARRITNGHQQEAEDLVQEAFQAAALAWAEFTSYPETPSRAGYGQLSKRAIDRWRITQRTQPVADVPDERQSPSAERVALSQMALDRCLQAIQKMPPAPRRMAVSVRHEDWSTKEIARELGIAQATVRVHLMNARRDLVDAVGNEIVLAEERDDEDDSRGKEA